MILVIDDDPLRQAGVRRALGRTIEARTYVEACFALSHYDDLALIMLDHDGVDGERLARLLADKKLHTQARIVIHSSNYPAAVRMRDIIAPTHRVEMVDWRDVVGVRDDAPA